MIHLCTHSNPDGDAIGSVFGVAHILRSDFRDVTIHLWGDLPVWFDKVWFFQGQTIYTTDPVPEGATIWLLDAPHRDRCGEGNVPESAIIEMLIDHHPDRGEQASDRYTDEDAGSACELIVRYFSQWRLDSAGRRGLRRPFAAAWLALGIRTDTLGMTTKSTSDHTFDALARLMSADDCRERIYMVNQIMHRTMTRQMLRFRAEVIGAAGWSDDACVMRIPRELRMAYGINENDAKVVLADTGSLADTDLVVLLIESDDGRRVRCSFRSQSDGRAQRMAILFGGGGHAQASGATVEGGLEDIYDQVIALL